ncbi:cell division protein ZapA [Sphingomonas nostoxanthinifaciens]|uniref:cell division protein ZapA n=1 Tax=Sphingomonas nostoxanthinifaciens TaxID=2872652 RepID=UPI001CC2117E|nr:cell division protein ZapA [Sphingomonas nostoxanthinifaciens]UAK23914.1 cell division protein ZapA [Sphingomonas nostoxanthinifaciens]
MAQVTLTIGGRRYDLACRDGGEDRLRMLGAMVDARATEAARAVGDTNEARQLLMAALLLADTLSDVEAGVAPTADDRAATAIDALAQRVESIAERLEKSDQRP